MFPSAPGAALPRDLDIRISGDRATITSTTAIGQEVSPAGDRWEAVQVNDCWLLNRLEYNREPAGGK